jgi:hypothetical protein
MTDERINAVFKFQDDLNLETLEHIKNFAVQSSFYPPQPKEIFEKGLILTKSGVLLSEKDEGHLVLIKEHKSGLLDTYIKVFSALNENISNKLFPLSERSLYELVTTQIFIEFSHLFPIKVKQRVATLLMIQHHKIMGNNSEANKVIKDMGIVLTKTDKDFKDKNFDNRVSTLLSDLPMQHPKTRTAVFDMFMSNRGQYKMHLNFRLHARTIALSEAVDLERPKARRMRHQIFLIYCGLQTLSYLTDSNVRKEYEALLKKFQDRFNEIREVFRWLSENHI